MKGLKNIEAIALKVPSAYMRIALAGAVQFAMDHKAEFLQAYGTYGMEGLKRLLEREEF